jgi:hypothetical protein
MVVGLDAEPIDGVVTVTVPAPVTGSTGSAFFFDGHESMQATHFLVR